MGQLGNGKDSGRLREPPVRVRHLSEVVQVGAGAEHACAVEADHELWCWGMNGAGQIGNGVSAAWYSDDRWDEALRVFEPVRVSGSFRSVSAGFALTCARTVANTVSCWGAIGAEKHRARTNAQPNKVPGLTHVKQIAVGYHHACALRETGSLWCWGGNSRGQLGDGTRKYRSAPTLVSALGTNVVKVYAGHSAQHTCAKLRDKSVSCWGANGNGQLGTGRMLVDHVTPTPMAVQPGWVDIAGGEFHSCGVSADGMPWCWGSGGAETTGLPSMLCVPLVIGVACGPYMPVPVPMGVPFLEAAPEL